MGAWYKISVHFAALFSCVVLGACGGSGQPANKPTEGSTPRILYTPPALVQAPTEDENNAGRHRSLRQNVEPSSPSPGAVFSPASENFRRPQGEEVRSQPAASEATLKRISFRASPSLRAGALAAISPEVLDELDAIFLGRLDLYAFIAKDSEVMLWLSGDKIEAARVTLRDGRELTAGKFPGSETSAPGFYDQEGRSLSSEILGRPLWLSRVTSSFGERLHPLESGTRFHHGIDYGAKVGTPVFAVGDGVVKVAASSPSAGNHLVISHDSGFESHYLHLQQFAPTTRLGNRVKQGEVIAFVGNSGKSTGPHLHYELHRNGVVLDPQKTLSLPSFVLGPLSVAAHKKRLEALP